MNTNSQDVIISPNSDVPHILYVDKLCAVVDATKLVPLFYQPLEGGGDFVESHPDCQVGAPLVIYEREQALTLIANVQKKYSRQNIAPELRRHFGLMNVCLDGQISDHIGERTAEGKPELSPDYEEKVKAYVLRNQVNPELVSGPTE